MSLLVADCPRCAAKAITFDVKAQVYCFTNTVGSIGMKFFVYVVDVRVLQYLSCI